MTERKEREKTSRGRPFKAGNPGRPKGSPNKFTTLKVSFLEAYGNVGGTDGLVVWINRSERNCAAVYTLITKLFPQEVEQAGPGGNPIQVVFQPVEPRNGGGNGNEDKRGNC
jgi:hypothetical protein